jgi:Ca2+-binding RTX toxin-like protein
VVTGGAGTDSLGGSTGADTITGGAGSDTLSGGADADRFVFAAGDASSTTLATLETITDFNATDDSIALGVVGSGTNFEVLASTPVDYAAALAAATGVVAAGTADIVTTTVSSVTYVFADTNADNVIDTVLALTGTVVLTSADFV